MSARFEVVHTDANGKTYLAGRGAATPVPIELRFWLHVDRKGPTECWEWTAHRNQSGYGMVDIAGKPRRAHRVSIFLATGRMPAANEAVRHHCDNPPCVNPAHLATGTPLDNSRDMISRGRSRSGVRQSEKTHCPQGHPYDDENTRHKNGHRSCRTCARDRAKRNRSGRRDALVRKWAAANGIDVAPRGLIRQQVHAMYAAAQGGARPVEVHEVDERSKP